MRAICDLKKAICTHFKNKFEKKTQSSWHVIKTRCLTGFQLIKAIYSSSKRGKYKLDRSLWNRIETRKGIYNSHKTSEDAINSDGV